jgi:hypothetical protein
VEIDTSRSAVVTTATPLYRPLGAFPLTGRSWWCTGHTGRHQAIRVDGVHGFDFNGRLWPGVAVG